MRAICHCTICQRFNDSPFGDVVVFRHRSLAVVSEAEIAFEVHRNPPLLRCGRCSACGRPAIETLSAPLLPQLALVPVANFDSTLGLPCTRFHIFYGSRRQDIDDDLPKISGYLRSEMQFAAALLAALR